MKTIKGLKKRYMIILTAAIILLLLILASGAILRQLGEIIVLDNAPVQSDAVIVLNTGIEYYPRLIEAAEIYRAGFAGKVVINGNRKTVTLRELEGKGFKPRCPWYTDSVQILAILGVPEQDILWISAEDAYDTVTEALAVGEELKQQQIKTIIITTSKFHTRRANFIWNRLFMEHLSITTIAAKADPYKPSSWWKEGRQIRWVLAEYGAWIYYWWKEINGI